MRFARRLVGAGFLNKDRECVGLGEGVLQGDGMTPCSQDLRRNEILRQRKYGAPGRLGGNFPRAIPSSNVLGVSLILLAIPNNRQTPINVGSSHLLHSQVPYDNLTG